MEAVELHRVHPGQLLATQGAQGEALGGRGPQLATELVAPVGVEAGEEVLVGAVAGVAPLVLHPQAHREAGGLQGGGLGLGGEEDVEAGEALGAGVLQGGPGQLRLPEGPVLAGGDQQASAGGGGEGHGQHQLRVVAHAQSLGGGGPDAIGDELAVAVPLEVRGGRRHQPGASPEGEVTRLPPRGGPHAATVLQRREEGPLQEGPGRVVEQRVPGSPGNLGDGAMEAQGGRQRVGHRREAAAYNGRLRGRPACLAPNGLG